MPVSEFLGEKAEKTERGLLAYVGKWCGAPSELVEAIEYSLFAGGKRLRPALALGAADIVSGDDSVALPAACSIEMIHTYSLIHDDLPAMDDDDLRRGKPTLHKAYDDATAILAGDALLTMAFGVLAETGNAAVLGEVALAAGVGGMVGGQFVDIRSEGKQLSVEELRGIHSRKTGALIRVSVRSGAMLAGADETALSALTEFGEHIGLAFQIADDLLDVEGAEDAIGKPVGSDQGRDKSTYPSIVGVERSREMAREAVDAATAALSMFGVEADMFRELASFIVERDR